MPTILDCLGVEATETIKGNAQSDFDGISMRYSFDDASADGTRVTQFYSMLGQRGIWHEGWKAVTTHPPLSGWSDFNVDDWELYHTDVDRAELHNLAGEMPEKVRELVNIWFAEAGRNGAFPLDDRLVLRSGSRSGRSSRRRARSTSTTRTSRTSPRASPVNIRNRSYSLGALVDIPAPGAEGVLFAHGARFGGHALYVKDDRLHYVYSFVGVMEQKIDATEDIPTGENLNLAASFEKDGEDPPGVATGILSLYHGDKKVGEGRSRPNPGSSHWAAKGCALGATAAPPSPTTTPACPPTASPAASSSR